MTDNAISARHVSDVPVSEVRQEHDRAIRKKDIRLAIVLALLVWAAILTPLIWLFF